MIMVSSNKATHLSMAMTALLSVACGGGAPPVSNTPKTPASDATAVAPETIGDTGEPANADTEEEEIQSEGSGGDWVKIPGGTFKMGSDSGNADEKPVHTVAVRSFDMLRTEVTVAEYEKCVFVEKCTWPPDNKDAEQCNWGHRDRNDHAINCVDWDQAHQYCAWIGGRLPTEAEWEYAARGGGKEIPYPWGDEEASCDRATMAIKQGMGCGEKHTAPVCAKPTGNTAQGLCDMAGNVWEWVEDNYHGHYNGAPADGSAWPAVAEKKRVVRGGSWMNDEAKALRTTARVRFSPNFGDLHNGFRCVR